MFLFSKVFPTLKKHHETHGGSGSFVIVATCSEKQGMCMYYMPLSEKEVFYMGNESTEEYGKQFEDSSGVEKFLGFKFNELSLPSVSISGTKFGNVFKGLKKLMGIGGKASGKGAEL